MDIIIGTQMVTKGHDFPGIALVGIVMADASLNLPDFRANERTYQIVTQVAGRAGRAEHPGEVVLQTLNPEHPVLNLAALQQGTQFYETELSIRRRYGFPPFRRLALLRFQHRNEFKVQEHAEALVQFVKEKAKVLSPTCHILGPSSAPISKMKNLYRWQCLIKSPGVRELQEILRHASDFQTKAKTSVQFSIDVDPIQSM